MRFDPESVFRRQPRYVLSSRRLTRRMRMYILPRRWVIPVMISYVLRQYSLRHYTLRRREVIPMMSRYIVRLRAVSR